MPKPLTLPATIGRRETLKRGPTRPRLSRFRQNATVRTLITSWVDCCFPRRAEARSAMPLIRQSLADSVAEVDYLGVGLRELRLPLPDRARDRHPRVAVVGCAGIVDLHNAVLVDHADQTLHTERVAQGFCYRRRRDSNVHGAAHSLSAVATPFFSGGVNAQVRFHPVRASSATAATGATDRLTCSRLSRPGSPVA